MEETGFSPRLGGGGSGDTWVAPTRDALFSFSTN